MVTALVIRLHLGHVATYRARRLLRVGPPRSPSIQGTGIPARAHSRRRFIDARFMPGFHGKIDGFGLIRGPRLMYRELEVIPFLSRLATRRALIRDFL